MMTEHNIGIIKTIIWQCCSHIRGIMPDAQLQEIAIAFTFLRRIDCLIGQYAKESSSFYDQNRHHLSDERLAEKLKEISGGYPFYNYSGYTFNGILIANSPLDIVMNSYLQGFSENVQEFLEGMSFKQNVAIMQRQSRYLVELFQLFSEMDLSSSSVDNTKFVELISSLISMGTREMSLNFTPYELSTLISECLLSEDVRDDNEESVTLYDPVCGTGCMLALAGEKSKSLLFRRADISLYGQEVSIYPSAIAKALVLLSGNEICNISYGNTLTDDSFSEAQFQYILADLPLGLQWHPIKKRIEKESFDVNGRFFIGLPGTSDSQLLFVEHILSKMDSKGSRAAFVSNASALWAGGASSGESRIRRWLFEKDLVETIISLPAGTMMNTSVSVYLWILSNKKNDTKRGKVRLINAASLPKKNRIGLDRDFVNSVVAEYKSTGYSTISQIVKNEDFGYYKVCLLENGKKNEVVNISLNTDIHDFVEKERQPFAKGMITVDYSSVEKGYEIRFDTFFKKEESLVASLKEASKDLLSIIDSITPLRTDIEAIVCCNKNEFDNISWRELPLRSAVEVLIVGNNMGLPVSAEEGLPLLSVLYLKDPFSNDQLYEVTPKNKLSTVKDVIIVMKGADLNPGTIFRGVDGILTPSTAAIKCVNESIIVPQYLYYLLKGYEKSFMQQTSGTSIKSLNAKSILDTKCLIPPVEEQIRIVSFLDDIISKIDNVLKVFYGSDNIFAQYRQILIENAVRGRINY